MKALPIDREKLRAQVRKQEEGALLVFLDRAIDLLPATKLARMVKDCVRAEPLDPDGRSESGLLDVARRFHAASLRGEYYEDFMPNWRNCTKKSRGTQVFIAECHRIVDLCVAAARRRQYAEPLAALGLIFDLLRRVDLCDEEIIFFADFGRADDVGIDWRNVLPVWCRCLARMSTPSDYARAILVDP